LDAGSLLAAAPGDVLLSVLLEFWLTDAGEPLPAEPPAVQVRGKTHACCVLPMDKMFTSGTCCLLVKNAADASLLSLLCCLLGGNARSDQHQGAALQTLLLVISHGGGCPI
jgi:hypothetical protein